MAPKKDLLTIKEMAKLINKSEATVRRRLEAGKFDTVEVGGELMIRRPA